MRKNWTNKQENGSDIDTTVHCSCGVSFTMYVSGIPYQCICKKLYEGKIIIEQITDNERSDNFVIIANPIPDLANLYSAEDENVTKE